MATAGNFARLRTNLMGMPDKPAQPPEGVLLQRALIRARLSARAAADKAGISEGRWRQIVNGYQSARGSHIPVTAPAATLAHMARALNVTPQELSTAGREDAADVLQDLITNSGPYMVTHTGGASTITHTTSQNGVARTDTLEAEPSQAPAVRYSDTDDPALAKVMRSDLSDDKKRKLVRLLIAEREAAEKRRVAQAEDLIRLVADEE